MMCIRSPDTKKKTIAISNPLNILNKIAIGTRTPQPLPTAPSVAESR